MWPTAPATAPRYTDAENAAWDRAEAELARDLDREYEPDPDWCWGVAS